MTRYSLRKVSLISLLVVAVAALAALLINRRLPT